MQEVPSEGGGEGPLTGWEERLQGKKDRWVKDGVVKNSDYWLWRFPLSHLSYKVWVQVFKVTQGAPSAPEGVPEIGAWTVTFGKNKSENNRGGNSEDSETRKCNCSQQRPESRKAKPRGFLHLHLPWAKQPVKKGSSGQREFWLPCIISWLNVNFIYFFFPPVGVSDKATNKRLELATLRPRSQRVLWALGKKKEEGQGCLLHWKHRTNTNTKVSVFLVRMVPWSCSMILRRSRQIRPPPTF